MLDKSKFENKAIRLKLFDGETGPDLNPGLASIACRKCNVVTTRVVLRREARRCEECGGSVEVDYASDDDANFIVSRATTDG